MESKAASSTVVTGATTPPPKIWCHNRDGSRPKPVTCSTVAVTSSDNPAATGSSAVRLSPAATGMGSVVAVARPSVRRWAASSAESPPISTPATTVPDGTRSARSHSAPT